jgi:hypothetical protein
MKSLYEKGALFTCSDDKSGNLVNAKSSAIENYID